MRVLWVVMAVKLTWPETQKKTLASFAFAVGEWTVRMSWVGWPSLVGWLLKPEDQEIDLCGDERRQPWQQLLQVVSDCVLRASATGLRDA